MGSLAWMDERRALLEAQGLRRWLRTVARRAGPYVEIGSRELVAFCSNDYLGLSEDPSVIAAAREAAGRWGTGSGASRLVSGNLGPFEELEARLAAFKGAEAALVCGSGYLANAGVIPALVGSGDLIVSDALNHASLIDGCRLSRATVCVVPHGDPDAVRSALAGAPRDVRRLIVTDGVFSMDGDLAPVPELVEVAHEYGAMLLVDDAHGTGVLGPGGGGTLEHFGLKGAADVEIGTFSKALGSYGAFVAGSRRLCDHLVNTMRSLIFSTGLPPPALAAAEAALAIVQTEPERRKRLGVNVRTLRRCLARRGVPCADGITPICPIMAGDANRAVSAAERLMEEGFFIGAIRPPSVPEGTSRLRLTISAVHEPDQIHRVAEAVARALGDAVEDEPRK